MNLEQRRRLVAFSLSLLIHIFLLSLSLPGPRLNVTKQTPRIPIIMTLDQPKQASNGKVKSNKQIEKKQKKTKKVKIKRPTKKLSTKKKIAKTTIKKKDPEKIVEKIEPISQPQRQPGDRDSPSVSQSTSPVYPKRALNNDWTGRIIIDVLIDEQGIPISHTVIKSTGHESLDSSFIQTVLSKYTFKPKREFGKNVKGKLRLDYEFE